MTRGRLIGFALVATLGSLLVTLAGLLAADLYVHQRAERSAGLNRWGYRGPVVGGKPRGEVRLAMLGGSTVFGYGGPWDEAIPALLERLLNDRDPGRRWQSINLGFNSEGVHALLPTLEDFAYLDYDLACFYVGYNDLIGDGGRNLAIVRHESPVFRLTGYFPILPLVLQEKALSLRSGGNLDAAYKSRAGLPDAPKVVFRPNLAATAIETVVSVGSSVSRQLDRLAGEHAVAVASTQAGCTPPWGHYCESVYRAIRYAMAHDKLVLVVAQPRMVDAKPRRVQEDQQQALREMVARHFGSEPRVAFLDLVDAVDLSDREYSFDQMHLGLDGNRVIASALVEPVRALSGHLRATRP